MRTGEVVEGLPPVDMQEQGVLGAGKRPGFALQGSDALSNGEIDAFDESSLDNRIESQLRETFKQPRALAPFHAGWCRGYHRSGACGDASPTAHI